MFVHDSQVIHATHVPLIALERHRIALDPTLLTSARRELLDGHSSLRSPFVTQRVTKDGAEESDRTGDRETGFRYGFLLGVEADEETHPTSLALANTLHSQLLAPLEAEPDLTSNAVVPGMRGQLSTFSLSFCKLAVGEPPRAEEGPLFEGPHLDTHPELTESVELLRLLVNLSEHPRRFLYAATDRWLLAEEGVAHGRREFAQLALPPGAETRVIAIPGRTETELHALRFLASAVPHVGLNDPPEHFLISFEALSQADREGSASEING